MIMENKVGCVSRKRKAKAFEEVANLKEGIALRYPKE